MQKKRFFQKHLHNKIREDPNYTQPKELDPDKLTSGLWTEDLQVRRRRPRPLPEQGHAEGVTAEGTDVLLDPAEGQRLVLEAEVPRQRLVFRGEESCRRKRRR